MLEDVPSKTGAATRLSLRWHLSAILLASLGGLFGIVGSFISEFRIGSGNPFFDVPILVAPVVEEILKPAGLYVLLSREENIKLTSLHVALLAAVAGLIFGLIEAVVYVTVYVDEPSKAFVIYRFSGPVVMHALSSFIMGLGINRNIIDAVKGWKPIPENNLKYIATAIGLHSLYNRWASVFGVFFQ